MHEKINNKNFFISFIINWGSKHYQSFPWRTTKNRWHALVAEIMLQRTRAEQVLPIYKSFCEIYETPSDYLKDDKASSFLSLGLIWRERELKKLSGILSKMEIPSDKKSLLELPGVGDYIASAYRSLHLGIRDIIIDSNVVRLYGRFFGFETDGETRRKIWFKELSERLTPETNIKEYNYGIIDFTRMVCKPKPLCNSCGLKEICHYHLFTRKY
jgi:A/G-specific adenine glycosylase